MLWSLVCPGIGEYKSGHRSRGLWMIAFFSLASVWLLQTSYGAVFGLSEAVKSRDPSLSEQPEDPGRAIVIAARLASAIHAEYLAQRANIHRRITGPLWTIFVLYAFSIGQACVLARKGRARLPASRSDHVASG
jgi:hypothetical protein